MTLQGAISIQNASKIYNPDDAAVVALQDCSMEIEAGEFAVLVGPSGCGKTTLLNAIAGFHPLSGGKILLDGNPLSTPGSPAKPGSDRIVVFQNGALFPWMTILENVSFGPLAQGRADKAQVLKEADEMLSTMGLKDLADEYPANLSSGMRRRAEIARAMMNRPKVLLLDEPFRALDALTKTVCHQFLMDVYDRTRPTVFFITHDLDEAIFLGTKVFIMTTRPAAIKKVLEIDLPRPRDYKLLASARYQELRAECRATVREEALKAFNAGERES